MRIVLITVGTRGDIQPIIALGCGLLRAGHQVRLVSHALFEPLARRYGLSFAPISVDPSTIMQRPEFQALAQIRNPIRYWRRMSALTAPLMEQMWSEFWTVSQDAQAMITTGLALGASEIAEKLCIPCYRVKFLPTCPTRAFPHPDAPPLPLGAAYNWLSHRGMKLLFKSGYRQSLNRWREQLGLAPLPLFNQQRDERLQLFAFSPTVIPRPPDWPCWAHVTGYWFLEEPADWQPPTKLADFLRAGPPPLAIGFGSMHDRDLTALNAIVLEALRRTRQRAVLLAGWAGIGGERELPSEVCLADDVPHSWLFPRVAAVIHHGGAGATAAGLRAGVPSILVPYMADQPFWGWRVARLGVGPKAIPRRQLTVDRLVRAIEQAIGDPAMRSRAAALGQRIQAESGVDQAVAVIQHDLAQDSKH